MPALLLERLPLPSLQTYVTLSVVFLASALLYTHHTVITSQSRTDGQGVVDQTSWNEQPFSLQMSKNSMEREAAPDLGSEEEVLDAETLEMLGRTNLTLPYDSYEMNFLWVLSSEHWCVWVSSSIAFS